MRSPARGFGRHEWRPHISRIERCRRSMHAARGVSDEMLDGQVRLGGTFRHIWPYGNIAISPHSNYKDLSQYRHNRSSLHPCSVRDGTRSLPHLPAGRALPNGQPEHWSIRQSLALAAPPDAQPQYAEFGTKAGSEKGGILHDAEKVGLLAYPRLSSTTTSTPLRRRSRLRSIGVQDQLDWMFTIKRNQCSRSTGTRRRRFSDAEKLAIVQESIARGYFRRCLPAPRHHGSCARCAA